MHGERSSAIVAQYHCAVESEIGRKSFAPVLWWSIFTSVSTCFARITAGSDVLHVCTTGSARVSLDAAGSAARQVGYPADFGS